MLFAVIGLIGLFKVYITPKMLQSLFNGSIVHDEIVGITAGAVSVGQPFLSYIIGGELLKAGVSYYAVAAFILSWITLGVVQLPLQIEVFGIKFTIWKNFLAIVFSVIISVATVWTVQYLGMIK
jgi:uncharacterized membrane protein YraQ (UPF0718 family)